MAEKTVKENTQEKETAAEKPKNTAADNTDSKSSGKAAAKAAPPKSAAKKQPEDITKDSAAVKRASSAKKADGNAVEKPKPSKTAVSSEKPVQTAAPAESSAKLKITLVKSLTGRHAKHIATAISLGLKKPGSVTIQPDNAQTRGKINQISYLITVTDM